MERLTKLVRWKPDAAGTSQQPWDVAADLKKLRDKEKPLLFQGEGKTHSILRVPTYPSLSRATVSSQANVEVLDEGSGCVVGSKAIIESESDVSAARGEIGSRGVDNKSKTIERAEVVEGLPGADVSLKAAEGPPEVERPLRVARNNESDVSISYSRGVEGLPGVDVSLKGAKGPPEVERPLRVARDSESDVSVSYSRGVEGLPGVDVSLKAAEGPPEVERPLRVARDSESDVSVSSSRGINDSRGLEINGLDGNELGGNEVGGNELVDKKLGGNEVGGNELGDDKLGGNGVGGKEPSQNLNESSPTGGHLGLKPPALDNAQIALFRVLCSPSVQVKG
jgi:hypothetical protein